MLLVVPAVRRAQDRGAPAKTSIQEATAPRDRLGASEVRCSPGRGWVEGWRGRAAGWGGKRRCPLSFTVPSERWHQAGCPSGQRERSVKPSAQPTLVRTQHLPPPAKTARELGISRLRVPSCVVSPCVISGQETPLCHGGYGHMTDGIGAGGAVHRTACSWISMAHRPGESLWGWNTWSRGDLRFLVTAGLSCSDLVFARESAEDLLWPDPALGEVGRRWPGVSLVRCELTEGAVRPGGVVVQEVFGQRMTQVGLADDQEMVQDLTAQRADDPLADGVRSACLRRAGENPVRIRPRWKDDQRA
jgi:hypothetical protein